MLRTSLLATALILMTSVPVIAQTTSAPTSAPAAGAPTAQAPAVPKSAQAIKLEKKAAEIAETFSPVEKENLGVLSDGFGIMHAVQLTNKSVFTTIDLCGKRNPEMKPDLDAAYKEWYGGFGPHLQAREADMKAAINDGRFSKPKDVSAFLDLLDQLAKHNYDRMEKQPLTTPSACERLVKTMDRTGEKLSKTLAELKFPYAVPKNKPAADVAKGTPN